MQAHLDAVLERACHLRVGPLQCGVDSVRNVALLLQVTHLDKPEEGAASHTEEE